MIGSVDPFAGSGKLRLRGTLLLGNSALLPIHLDHDASHRLCVPADVLDVLIGHRFRVLTEQFTTTRDRNRIRFLFRTMEYIHSAPLERESRRFVFVGGAPARRFVSTRRCRVSADAGLEPASSRRSYAPRGDDREWFDRLVRSV